MHTGDLPLDEFERHASRLAAWIRSTLEHPERVSVLSRAKPGDIRALLPARAPQQGESMDAILADLDRVVMPGVTHWNHPGFLAYFANTASVPGILGELVTAALNQVGILWRTGPAAAEIEQVACDWLRDALGFPAGWFGMITDTASISTMYALAAARERDPALAIRQRGMAGRSDLPRLRVYCSEHAHSSVDKACIALGLGLENVIRVATDESYRLRPEMLARVIAADRSQGFRPLAVVATAGTTSTTSVDPIAAIAQLCARESLWLHVDAAYGGAMGLLPEARELFAGIEQADSVVVNAHKWLFTPMDCSVLWTKHPRVFRRTFALTPSYLETTDGEQALNFSDYGVQLGRRFRALKLWFVMRAFGVEGMAARVREHVRLAQVVAGWVTATPEWELCAPTPMSVVCFRHMPPGVTDESELEAHNALILEKVNASGEVFLSHTKLGQRYVLRIAIGNLRTEERHLARAWELLGEAAG
ncbi:MAG: amino acid decarboxylase [Gemmatimonadaceae bacterium]|nr:amino acid decarboxylase [Gemmatimonadaceae bacterium]